MGGIKGRSGKYMKTESHKDNLRKSLMGHIVSDETKLKIGKANKGRKQDPIMVKIRNESIRKSNTGKIFDKERREAYKLYWESRKGKKPWNYGKEFLQIKGSNHWNWQGGLSFEAYPVEFNNKLKNTIRRRDGYTCQICNTIPKNEHLAVHHIDYNKKNNLPNNLVSLCRKCHTATNFKRDEWQLFFKKRRQYLPTFSDLIDRLGICQLKAIFIPEHSEEYKKEINIIIQDLTNVIYEGNIHINAKMIHAMLVNILCNRVIWENESKARVGGSEQDKLLKFTHSINGIRNTAKNIISQELGERVDLKIDCLAEELVKEFGNWNVF